MDGINRQWVVARRPQREGMCLERECFGRQEDDIPEPDDGQILIRNIYFACEPLVHAWVRGVPGKIDPLPIGSPFKGHAGGHVVASKNPSFKVGDAVHGNLDWADYSLSDGTDESGSPLQRAPEGYSLETGMVTLGMSGLCAYIGMFDIGQPKPGDTVVVSGAAGGIGVIAGQIAKLAGARVIGIAGGPEKCTHLVGEVGYDAAVDYKNEDVTSRLSELAPEGVNVFFDNVGGEILDSVLVNLAPYGRIVVCGGISGYDQPGLGIHNHMVLAQRNGTMRGFWYSDHAGRYAEGIARLGGWLKDGSIKEVLDIAEGFDVVPEAACGVFSGANTGKQLVRIAKDSSV